MIINRKNFECPCKDCKFYTSVKRRPNPNSYDEHYCEKKQKSIRQHNGNAFHFKGQWIMPCGGYAYVRKGGVK